MNTPEPVMTYINSSTSIRLPVFIVFSAQQAYQAFAMADGPILCVNIGTDSKYCGDTVSALSFYGSTAQDIYLPGKEFT
jgi:hypothetical protein